MIDSTERLEYIKLTVERNALDYLERASQFIRETEINSIAWKWVILALHGSLYGFAISACRGTDNRSVTKNKNVTKNKEYLITLDDALKRCQNEEWMSTLIGGLPLSLSNNQKQSIIKLKDLRNKFEHYVPEIWSIQISDLPHISIDILDIIEFLSIKVIRYQHLNNKERRRIKEIISDARILLEKNITI